MVGFDWSAASAEERRAYVARVNAAECAAQGLPHHIEDPVVLRRLAHLFAEPARKHEAETTAGRRAS